jgi:hypothetical protein
VNLKNVLRQIQSDCFNLHSVTPLLSRFGHLQYGASRRQLVQEPSTPPIIDSGHLRPLSRHTIRLRQNQTRGGTPNAYFGSPFGLNIQALALYLKHVQHVSYQRLQAMFADVFGMTISQGALGNMFERAPAHGGGRAQ